jgi:hypothetical protein
MTMAQILQGTNTMLTPITKPEYLNRVFQIARSNGYPMEINRQGLRQIDFGHKKLHEGHMDQLYPQILAPRAHIPSLIERVAPGRPCTHKPMRLIIEKLTADARFGTSQ